MARPLRIEFDGALYHVTSRGNGKRDIFLDDTDRLIFLDTLEEVIKKFNWLSHAYCLMNNHYHLLVETPDGNISSGMRHLNGVYTQRFNKRHNKVGHLFQGRYKAILINKESHLLEVARYIVLNPVRAKLVEKPQFWKWSSFSATAYGEEHPCVHVDWILSQFSDDVKNAKRQYIKFVLAGVGEDSIWKDVTSQILLGDEVFIEKFLNSRLFRHYDI
jgi:REP element-mobilizing transposase RayT